MKILVRSIQLTATGREIVRDRDVEGDVIGVGRASENAIALPDLAVEQQHLSITQTPSGTLQAKAVGGLGFTHDGVNTMEAEIDPARGGELGVGSYRLEIGQGEGGEVLVTIRRAQEDEGEGRDQLAGFGIASVLPSRRVMSWTAVVAIVVAFLAIPIFTHLTREPVVEPSIEDTGSTLMDASWSTGALSSVHHGLEDNCEACHTEPFVAVRDETCLTCHGELADHAEQDRLVAGMPEFSGGEAFLWSVAHAFNKPGPGACTDCHTEHEGTGRMEPTSEKFCADCHETLDTRLTDTALGNASDFGQVHPQFQALVRPARGAEEIRLSLDTISTDFNGLKFPHDMHLSTTNGVARMAMRLGINAGGGALECDDCHQTTADGVSFLPVEMEDSCESCHSLVYDRVGNTFRSLSHGDVEQTQADLMASDRSPRRPVASGRRRPGPFAEGGLYYGNFSRVMPGRLTRAALDDGALCGECHYPADGAELAVVPVTQRSRWFQHGWFDHDAHTQEDCSSCHAADTSDSSTDLLLPDLESCRDCHLGETALEAEVPSSCAMCHSYHPPQGVDSAPHRVASLTRRREQEP
ncbi:cytochrome c3 family protein [Aurantiacibacter sp. MUD11]|uniref:cytochrome c3 family protein n=1 Tax=Aurantiacibacter sp. MUD11 TaxID=3003265 RepID=UPI0022AAC59E|nr:cytochrome c3 family protein [Aurantiacibacter sp. MUD11]WAT16834.1 cytochrome c3 family protein [Aurantiacibacter sp. MUD11]